MAIRLEVDAEMGPAVGQGFMIAAQGMYLHLAQVLGPGDWVDELRARLRWEAAMLQAPEGSHPEVAEKWADAAMMAVDAVFDHLTFENENPRH